jgi:type IV pilus assembly protein PilE
MDHDSLAETDRGPVMMAKNRSGGFTLLELMIVVVIIAMLAAFAMFNYSKYAFRTRRADGKEMLMRVASAEERYYTNFNKYVIDDLATLGFTAAAPCNIKGASEKCYYVVSVATNGAAGDTQSYKLTATPQAPSQNGDACKNLTIDNTGTKLFTGQQTNGNCW